LVANHLPIKKKAKLSKNPAVDKIWLDHGGEIVKNTLQSLDERAKHMITTCAGLIVVNLGLFLAFPTQNIEVTPQFFFIISTGLFAISYFPIKKKFNFFLIKSIKDTYDSWLRWKLVFQYLGFILFFIGIATLGLVNFYDFEKVQQPTDETKSTMLINTSGVSVDNISMYMSKGNGTFQMLNIKPTPPESK